MHITITSAKPEYISRLVCAPTLSILSFKTEIVTIFRLRSLITNDITPEQIRLIFHGRLLNNNKTLSQEGITDGVTVHMVINSNNNNNANNNNQPLGQTVMNQGNAAIEVSARQQQEPHTQLQQQTSQLQQPAEAATTATTTTATATPEATVNNNQNNESNNNIYISSRERVRQQRRRRQQQQASNRSRYYDRRHPAQHAHPSEEVEEEEEEEEEEETAGPIVNAALNADDDGDQANTNNDNNNDNNNNNTTPTRGGIVYRHHPLQLQQQHRRAYSYDHNRHLLLHEHASQHHHPTATAPETITVAATSTNDITNTNNSNPNMSHIYLEYPQSEVEQLPQQPQPLIEQYGIPSSNINITQSQTTEATTTATTTNNNTNNTISAAAAPTPSSRAHLTHIHNNNRNANHNFVIHFTLQSSGSNDLLMLPLVISDFTPFVLPPITTPVSFPLEHKQLMLKMCVQYLLYVRWDFQEFFTAAIQQGSDAREAFAELTAPDLLPSLPFDHHVHRNQNDQLLQIMKSVAFHDGRILVQLFRTDPYNANILSNYMLYDATLRELMSFATHITYFILFRIFFINLNDTEMVEAAFNDIRNQFIFLLGCLYERAEKKWFQFPSQGRKVINFTGMLICLVNVFKPLLIVSNLLRAAFPFLAEPLKRENLTKRLDHYHEIYTTYMEEHKEEMNAQKQKYEDIKTTLFGMYIHVSHEENKELSSFIFLDPEFEAPTFPTSRTTTEAAVNTPRLSETAKEINAGNILLAFRSNDYYYNNMLEHWYVLHRTGNTQHDRTLYHCLPFFEHTDIKFKK